MAIRIVITTQIEGTHCWPEARELLPEVDFLADKHRHIFQIKAKKTVDHEDRDVEIILFKRSINQYLEKVYGNPADFGRKSCEEIAKELVKKFGCQSVEVLEDGENGAEITRD